MRKRKIQVGQGVGKTRSEENSRPLRNELESSQETWEWWYLSESVDFVEESTGKTG